MLLKVSLFIAILAGVVTLFLSHVQLADSINNLKETLQSTREQLTRAEEDAASAKKDAKASKEQAEQTAKELEETRGNLETATSKWKEQQTRADEFEEKFTKAAGQLTEAQRELSAWGALGIQVEQARGRLAELTKLKEANDAMGEENKVLSRKVDTLAAELSKYTEERESAVALPAGLKGKVVAVDSKWDFVVLDIGANQGALERGEMLVNRDGKLVAKVRITTVEPNRSIANVLPEWKQVDVIEGDQVIH
jgi:predicted  nucleic acid-binding Zn-ribbon protein